MSVAALSAENVGKSFRHKPAPALNGVSFDVYPGEVVGLLGPNGAGKTTLLKIITSLILPTSGVVRIFGVDIAKHPDQARTKVGLVSCDERSFYWRLSGRQNLTFFGALHGLSGKHLTDRINSILDALGLLEAADAVYQTYSSGMKQRLSIARGILSEPAIIFYDEPTRSLDPLNTQNIRHWIRERRSKLPDQTHLVATNQLSEAEALCDRVVILNRGRLIASGTVEEIRGRFQAQRAETHTVVYRGGSLNGSLRADVTSGLLSVSQSVAGDCSVELTVCTRPGSPGLSKVFGQVIGSGATILRCDTARVSFDEAFCALVEASNDGASQEVQ